MVWKGMQRYNMVWYSMVGYMVWYDMVAWPAAPGRASLMVGKSSNIKLPHTHYTYESIAR